MSFFYPAFQPYASKVPPPFSYPHRVTYAECTMGNHVYYARYLDWLEAARSEFFRHLGITFQEWQQRQVIFPVIECRLRYHAPARYDDQVHITLVPLQAHGIRLSFSYRILNPELKLLVEGETLHVCTDLDDKPSRLPEQLCALLAPWLPPTPSDSLANHRQKQAK